MWSCESPDRSEFKAGPYVTMSTIIWGPTEGIAYGFEELVGWGGVILDLIGITG